MLVGRQPNLILVFEVILPLFWFSYLFSLSSAVCFDVCSYFSIIFIDATEERTTKKEICPQKNSKNEEKNATNANTR